MPRLIFKCPYLKAGESTVHAANLVEYIATRDGVDFIADANRSLPATKKQKDLIEQILRDIPTAKNLFEHEDYEQQPTIENASEFITQALDQHLHESGDRDYYVKYIAERPRVEKIDSHGLFTAAGIPVVLLQVQREVSEHTGNIWTPIISLQRDDAVRLSYDSGRQWQALLRSQAAEIASHMKIHPDNFRWYAAYHNESHHPHVHMVCWSTDPAEGYLTKQGIAEIKSGLVRQIFRQDLTHIYEQQTDRRGKLTMQSLEAMQEMCGQIKNGVCNNPEVETLIVRLSERLANTGGKKVYGFLKPDVKDIVDRVVDELAKDERVAGCYNAWYEMREEILHTYHDELPSRVPLSAQKEFKQIKNMVITEAANLGGSVFYDVPAREVLPYEIDMSDTDATEPAMPEDMLPTDDGIPGMAAMPMPESEPAAREKKPHARWTNEYKQARVYLFGSVTTKPDFEKAYDMFLREAQTGNVLAMHDLGRICADGLGMEINTDAAYEWYEKALAGFLRIESEMEPDDHKATYLRYRIGKMYMAGLGTEQDYSKAAAWLGIAAADGHKYAQYSLGSLYYRGLGVERDNETAFGLYGESAAQENAYASYELAKMYRDGVGTQADATEANNHFQTAYSGFVEMELDSADDKLQYRIGQMLRDGIGVNANAKEAEFYFERSAQLGNPHAQYALAKMYLSDTDREKIAVALDLLHKSAGGGNPTAQYALGKLYRDGEHVGKDMSRAVELLTKSAEQKNDYAAYALGKLYLAGEDMQKEVSTAVRWLAESAGQGNQFAQYALGKLYLAGEDVQKDVSTAVRWLSESAGQGNQFAQYALGMLYIKGKDVPRDRDEALRWFIMAAEQGNEYARFFIDHIGEIGVRDPDLFMASTRLLRQLGKIFEQQNRQLDGQTIQIDRKRLRILREKKMAQGHARDDHEPKHGGV